MRHETVLLISIIFLIVGLTLAVIGDIYYLSDIGEKKVDCYDYYQNKIEGVKCIQQGSNQNTTSIEEVGLIVVLLGVLIFGLGLLVFTIEITTSSLSGGRER